MVPESDLTGGLKKGSNRLRAYVWRRQNAPSPVGLHSVMVVQKKADLIVQRTCDHVLCDWINLRLDEIVYFVLRISPHVFTPPTHYLPALRRLLEQDRELLRSGRAPARQHFINSIRKLAMSWNRRLPAGREDEFATWIYSNPSRCPGLRLQHETYRALMANYGDVLETADFSDLAHVCAIPYVEAATLDNRMRHYAGVAARKLVRMGSAINFRDRMFTNLAAIMQIQP